MYSNSFASEYKHDVVVCGSGPAGLGAAMSAGLAGANVMLLESANLLGGIINAVPWMSINRLLLNKKQRTKVHGLLVKHIQKYGDQASHAGREGNIPGDGLSCHVEYSEMAIYDMLEKADIEYKMFSPVVDVIKEDNKVTGVIVREKQGYVAYHAGVIVDATGDGDVGYAAGCEYMDGREKDGIHMPITLGFSIGGMDKKPFFDWLYIKGTEKLSDDFKRTMDDAHSKGYYVAAWHSFENSSIPGIIGITNGAWRDQSLKSSGLNSTDLTTSRRNGLKLAIDLVRIFKDYNVPGAANIYLERTGNILGVRDSRRIVGEYIQTYEDSQKGTEFKDVVSRKNGGVIDGNQIFKGPMVSGFGIPYRALVPKDVDGLLLAGRCASMSFLGHCAGKSMGNMMEMGVAAGAAAALCSRQKTNPRDLDIAQLQNVLKSDLDVVL